MSHDQNPDLSQYSMLDLFRMEAQAQAMILTDGLLALERAGGTPATLESMMRAAHSIKGAAAIVGLDVVVQLAHGMEDAFIATQRGALQLTPARIDVLLAGVDLVLQLSTLAEDAVAGWLAQQAAPIRATMAAIGAIAQVREAAPLAPLAPTGPIAPAGPIAPPAPPAAPPFAAEPKAAPPGADQLLALASQARVQAHRMQPVIGSLQRMKRHQASLFQALDHLHEAILQSGDRTLLEHSALALQRSAPLRQLLHEHMAEADIHEQRALALSKNMFDQVLALRMRPLRDGVHPFARMVRDLARSLGKEAQLLIEGEDTPVDRDILAAIESPLNHMLRNALDHGIETPAERVAAGKPALGTIHLSARHRAGMLSIEIRDDGRGADLERIRQTVIARKMASPAMAAAMAPAELLEFLFLPAFSLKESASEISGRGVGLDVVRQAVRQQNGSVRIESEPGRGLRAAITLPLTQSMLRALVIEIQGEAYAIPIVKVERVLKLARSAIHTLESKQFFDFGGEHLGLVSAAQVLDLGQLDEAPAELPVVVLGAGRRRYALVVDAIRGEQSLAVQALDPVFGKMRDIAAASLLDDGAPVLILDVPDLLLSIDKLLHEGGLHQLARHGELAQRQAKRILVVDDSLTVREMERKLLLARGYRVDVAIDGIDGWNVVRSGDYDLLITDVDMPRMDGIELLQLVKKDIRLHQLPVMIVSYKDRPEDRARGLTAGADYYLTKGSFHDATLLDAVMDLIGEASR